MMRVNDISRMPDNLHHVKAFREPLKVGALSFLLTLALAVASNPGQAAEPIDARQEKWHKQYSGAIEALRTGRYGDGERMIKQAVIDAAVFGEGDKRFADSLGEYGRLLTMRGRFSEAQPLLEEELHAREIYLSAGSAGGGAPGDVVAVNPALIPAMSSLVSFYLNYGTAEKADGLADRLLAIIDGKINDYREAKSGPVTLKKGEALTGWAGSAAKSMVNPVIEWAIAVDAIGNDFRSKGKLDLAERCYNSALDVKETVLGKEHLSLANSFDNLASVYEERNDENRAQQYYSYALETTERILPPENYQVYNRLDKLAKCYIKQKNYQEAEKLYLRAQDFWKEPSRNGSEARAAFALGNLYVLEKRYDEAVPLLQKALSLAEAFYGPDSISLVPFLQRYADTMYYLGQEGPRQELKARASAISGATM